MQSKAPHPPRLLGDFDYTKARKMGRGVSASLRVPGSDGMLYQLKQPNEGQSLKKRAKAAGTDQENVGEFAAACIVNALVAPEEAHLFPEVLAFYHYKNPKKAPKKSGEEKTVEPEYHEKSIYIASRYLQGDPGGVCNLDEYILQQLNLHRIACMTLHFKLFWVLRKYSKDTQSSK